MENSSLRETVPTAKNNGQDPNAVIFDTNSGFSIEEQQEILNKINSLSVERGIVPQADLRDKQLKKAAKKRGIFFPLLVNIGAVLLLAGGFILLWTFHNREEQEIQRGSAVLSLMEQRLIQEIREETARQLSEKEREINDIRSRLASAGEEYREQYQTTLSRLQDEQLQILESARLREAGLWAQAAERGRDNPAQNQSLDAAGQELVRLTGEQNIVAAIDAQLGGYYVMEERLLRSGQLDEAVDTLKNMRDFLNSSLLMNYSYSETERQMHLTAVNVMEEMLGEIISLSTGNTFRTMAQDDALGDTLAAMAELQTNYDALEKSSADKDKLLAAYSSEGSEQTNMIRGLESDIRGLRTDNDTKDREITRLNGSVDSLNTQLQAANTRVSTAETDLAAQVRQNAEVIRQNSITVGDLTQRNNDLTAERDNLQNRNNDLQRKLNDDVPQAVNDALGRIPELNMFTPEVRQNLAQIIQNAIQEAVR